ncbi:hypothetical protein CTEN210_16434 [Chaetoceros tenuissimus]|uniref:Circumsporozoite protein n=1 Tax=Chaetoceros tenuissimus TaxID=426638 RepID=A0AAD3HEE6_9STRA|nr:hypothetical protein CTEN210_16434 [Chaetoceros tenuissimus]
MRFSNLSINLLLACCCYTSPHLAQAEPIIIDASKPFTKTINDEIVCEKVIKLHMMIQKTSDIKDGVYGVESFACVVAPEYTPSGDTPGITLSMPDVDETFEEAFASAQATGHTELVVKNPLVHRSTLKLPSSSQEEDGSASSFSGSMFYSQVVEPDSDEDASNVGGGVRGRRATALTRQDQMCYSPHVQWRRPSNVDGSVQRGRKLAVNQTGTKSVVVFRATVDNTAPSIDAATIKENVFSTASNMITLSSQFSACSNNQLNFEAGAFTEFTYADAASGVVEVALSNDVFTEGEEDPKDISNAIYTQFGTNMDQIDHKMFVVPPETDYKGSTTWVAFASKPGDDGWYRDDWILDVSTLMHETGHNLGLHHSGQPDDTANVEYGDSSCTMGYTIGVDRAICFNGAKSVELGWYDDRVATISPHVGDEFSGRLIGVNDYAISNQSDTLVVEIKNSDSSVDSLFVMYNKAEGLNEDTSEAVNKVIITQGVAGGQSWKLAEITPGQTWTSENYVFGKTLSISTSAEASEGNVQYVTTTIKFTDTACSINNECTTDLQNYNCLSEQCVNSVCKIINQDDCCGNGLCDAAEYCDTCDDCLNTSDHCKSIVASWSNASTSSGIYGISFDVTVTKDVYFHEISDVFVFRSGTYTVKVYTREGTNTGENDLSNWVQVYSGSIAASNVSGRSYITSIPFTSRVSTSSGGTRAFYVDVTGSTQDYKIPYEKNNNPVSNSDMSMSSATTRRASSITTIGAARTDVGTFIGTLKYGYAKGASPTSFPSSLPSDLPSLSIAPSDAPSNLPSLFPSELPSMQPSDIPSDVPSDFPSDEPSDIPSDTPSDVPSDVPSDLPSDSPSDVPSDVPSDAPSFVPSAVPSDIPSDVPSDVPSGIPSFIPSDMPSSAPSVSSQPSATESDPPSTFPSSMPSDQPSLNPSTLAQPSLSSQPSDTPSSVPSDIPSGVPSSIPSSIPSNIPSLSPSDSPSSVPSLSSLSPSELPSFMPSISPSSLPSIVPSDTPSLLEPSSSPSSLPSMQPSKTNKPSAKPSASPSSKPSAKPSVSPSSKPSAKPSAKPSINQGDNCKDSGVKFKKKINADGEYKKRSCAWLLRKPEKTLSRCESGNKQKIKKHCPNACGACEQYKCADSEKKWFLWGDEEKMRNCKWVGEDPGKIARRCGKNGVAATCRATCKYTNTTLGLSC